MQGESASVPRQSRMARYKFVSKLGNGTHGSVKLYRNTITSRLVAIKKMRRHFQNWDQCMQLNEIRSLKKLCSHAHPNIILCEEVIKENNRLYLIFEVRLIASLS